jgi:hypothetical protein
MVNPHEVDHLNHRAYRALRELAVVRPRSNQACIQMRSFLLYAPEHRCPRCSCEESGCI